MFYIKTNRNVVSVIQWTLIWFIFSVGLNFSSKEGGYGRWGKKTLQFLSNQDKWKRALHKGKKCTFIEWITLKKSFWIRFSLIGIIFHPPVFVVIPKNTKQRNFIPIPWQKVLKSLHVTKGSDNFVTKYLP